MTPEPSAAGDHAICPLCLSRRTAPYARHSRVAQVVRRCVDCALYFAWPHQSMIPTVTDGAPDRDFTFWGSECAHIAYQRWRTTENREIGALALAHFPDGRCERLLEIGFGEGPLTEILLPATAEYWGIEPVPATCAKTAQALGLAPERALCCRAEDLGAGGPVEHLASHFDMVVMVSVFEHLSQPRQVLEDCLRLLKPGGRLLISTPDSTFFRQLRLLRRLAQMEPWTHFHVSFFKPANLERAFQAVGFEVLTRLRRPLVTSESIAYFAALTDSAAIGWLMRMFKRSGLAALLRTHTLFYVLRKPHG
ncbi:MAG: class I SAM-dependent methyltransferase [Gammaproteobacteria bacterium]